MSLPGKTGGTGEHAGLDRPRRPDEWTVFIPKVLDGGGWARMAPPQREPRAACLIAAADMRLARPGMPQWEAQARAACAARLLADGITGAVLLDEQHRVDRIDL